MIKISISLLLDAIEENINDEELQSIDFESYIRKITKEFQGENGEFLVKEEAFETLPLDRDKKDKIIEQIKQNNQNVFKDDFDTLLQLYFWEPRIIPVSYFTLNRKWQRLINKLLRCTK